jgi:hypothetical protein
MRHMDIDFINKWSFEQEIKAHLDLASLEIV